METREQVLAMDGKITDAPVLLHNNCYYSTEWGIAEGMRNTHIERTTWGVQPSRFSPCKIAAVPVSIEYVFVRYGN